jgi:hypothetical protein
MRRKGSGGRGFAQVAVDEADVRAGFRAGDAQLGGKAYERLAVDSVAHEHGVGFRVANLDQAKLLGDCSEILAQLGVVFRAGLLA